MFGTSPPFTGRTDQSRPAGRRGAARLRVYFPGRLIMIGGTYPCWLEDISQTGARVICQADIRQGKTGIFQSMDIEVLCTIVRAGNGRLGLQFEEDVSAEAIQEMRRRHDHSPKGKLSEEKVYARRWATGIYS